MAYSFTSCLCSKWPSYIEWYLTKPQTHADFKNRKACQPCSHDLCCHLVARKHIYYTVGNYTDWYVLSWGLFCCCCCFVFCNFRLCLSIMYKNKVKVGENIQVMHQVVPRIQTNLVDLHSGSYFQQNCNIIIIIIVTNSAVCLICFQERVLAVMTMFRRRMFPPLVKGSLTRTIWGHCSYRSVWGQSLGGKRVTPISSPSICWICVLVTLLTCSW